MKADDITLQKLLNSPSRYLIPVFQRYYSWGRDNWEKLWEDVSALQDPDQPHSTHFMGSLVFVSNIADMGPNKLPVYLVIDGQQRLITLSLLLCALRNLAVQADAQELAAEITNNFLIHQYKKGPDRFRIYPRQRDREQYLAAIPAPARTSGRVAEALDYFTGQIRLVSGAETIQTEALESLFATLQTRLEFVYINLNSGENPYQVFKSLNSTGVDLSEADLIRNFIFMHVEIDRQDEFDEQQWLPLEQRFELPGGQLHAEALSRFFRDFLMQRGRYVAPTSTFQAFETRYAKTNFDPINVVVDLHSSIEDYDIIRGRRPHPLPAAQEALVRLRQLDSSTAYPLLLNLMEKVRNHEMTEQDFAKAVELLTGFILRRFICGESSRGYARSFVSACNAVEGQPLAGLRSFLIAKGFPRDDWFRTALLRYPLYRSGYAKSILETLEKSLEHKEPVDLSQAQIEHIMPQTLSDDWKAALGPEFERVHSQWLHTLGNLTLSGYNPELQNKKFAVKRDVYRLSHITLTQKLADYNSWTETEIMQRGQSLAERAAKIWIGPEV